MSMKRSTINILITVAVAVGGVAFLGFQSAGDVEYYAHVDQVVADPSPWMARSTIQVHGFAHQVPLEPVLDKASQTVSRKFELENKGKIIQVIHEGTVPDTFKEEAETVVKGTLTKKPDGSLLLTTVGGESAVMAKCPSKYQAGKK
jgi:cytochrome c-type biogenesis protein CcmE